ncbi:MauE/DoxX family redox-associated membrane protein [Micromonospora sp. NPDC051196]|uniref:MauE/DoxX family redox-associated membrane protein n=1 Tax=Micromonospora sp. NPDC051196 TaxID=3155281 RepID=UPI00342B21AD
MSGFSALVTVVTVVTVVALGGALLLLVAGVGHATHPQRVRSLLARQGLLPSVVRAWVGRLLGVTEVGVAVVVLGVVLLAPGWAPAGYALLAGGYALLAVYAELLRRRRPGAPCGCLAGGQSTGLPVVIRALIFAAAAAAAAAAATAAAMAAADPVAADPVAAGWFSVAVAAAGEASRPGLELWLAAGVTAAAGWLIPELVGGGTVANRR